MGSIGGSASSPTVAKHRLFTWLQVPVCPDHQLIAIVRGDDTTLGILHSRFHEAWYKRTLTNLYNERPAWLTNAHRDLDNAVAAAYAWPADISEEDALARLFALNLSRAQVADQRRAR